MPPRHGKSELVLHWISWALLRHPDLRIAYVTYNDTQAKKQARKARRVAIAAGIEIENRAAGSWEVKGGGVVDWQGVQGTLTGQGYDVIIVDDPVKNRGEAESPTMRDKAWDFYQSDCITRLESGGSFLCIQTRWHEDDLAGRLIREDPEEDWDGLEYVSMPAIANEGSEEEIALWPQRWPLEALKRRRKRVGSYAWSSLYQGHPVPRGSTVFKDPTFYMDLPKSYQVAQGLDLAYSEKTSSDWSICVTMFKSLVAVARGDDPVERLEEWFYVRHVVRRQVRASEFKAELRLERARFPNARVRIYASGTELGAASFLQKADIVNGKLVARGIELEALPPRGDKYTRAIDFSEAWNEGRVLVPAPELVEENPEEYGWLHDYLDVVRSFTGVSDAHDDDVDASVAAFDLLATPRLSYPGRGSNSARRRV